MVDARRKSIKCGRLNPKNMSKKLIVLLVIIVAVGAAIFLRNYVKPYSVTGGEDLTQAPVSADTVIIQNFTFAPATLQVAVGTRVVWQQNDSVVHTVTSDENLFASGELAKGDQFSFTFAQAGEYKYHCGIHSSMHGTIIVH